MNTEKTIALNKAFSQKERFLLCGVLVALASILFLGVFCSTGCATNYSDLQKGCDATAEATSETQVKKYDGYKLEQVTAMSRHNLRTPLTSSGSSTEKMSSTKTWIDWSAPASELSLKGGQLETIMGQYFREYLEDQNLMPHNWQPQGDEVLFYSNSLQRTIATAHYFSTGMLPTANKNVFYKGEFNKMQDTFNPCTRKLNDSIKEKAYTELQQSKNNGEIDEITNELKDEYTTLENLIDFKNSTYAKEKGIENMPTDDSAVAYEEGKEPKMTGSLKEMCSLADAVKLQYYEEEDNSRATFNQNLSYEQLKDVCKIVDEYQKVLFGHHTVGVIESEPLIQEIEQSMKNTDRKFTYFCGHDSNILSILSAMQVKEYKLPNSLEEDTPIGCKLVFKKWANSQNEEFVSISMVYQSTFQLRYKTTLTNAYPPMEYQLEFEGMEKNADGLYKLNDVLDRFDSVESEYAAL